MHQKLTSQLYLRNDRHSPKVSWQESTGFKLPRQYPDVPHASLVLILDNKIDSWPLPKHPLSLRLILASLNYFTFFHYHGLALGFLPGSLGARTFSNSF